jgi:hypothetical protein
VPEPGIDHLVADEFLEVFYQEGIAVKGAVYIKKSAGIHALLMYHRDPEVSRGVRVLPDHGNWLLHEKDRPRRAASVILD